MVMFAERDWETCPEQERVSLRAWEAGKHQAVLSTTVSAHGTGRSTAPPSFILRCCLPPLQNLQTCHQCRLIGVTMILHPILPTWFGVFLLNIHFIIWLSLK